MALSNSEARNSSTLLCRIPSAEGQCCQAAHGAVGGASEQPRERLVYGLSQGRCSGSSLSVVLPVAETARALVLLGTWCL